MAINNTVENINNQPTIEPRTVTGIFTKYIAKTLPLAFDESMSYYECLCALLEYLNETIVPDINNTNEGLSELQTFYLDLQDYVNNYFDNLDVQDEINNKLDRMTQDGTLTAIIKDYVDPIYQAYETEINATISSQTERINDISSLVNSLASGSPLVASDVSGMTETDRIYVNTTDGKWYYYDGDSWEIGGTYQSTGIGENEVKLENLSINLQNIFSTDLSNVQTTSGHYIRFDGVYSNANSFSVTDSIPVKKGETIYCKTAVTNNMAVFSEKVDTTYYPLVTGIEEPGSTVIHEYFYTAKKDMYVVITFRHNLDYTYYKFISSNELVKLENIKEYTPSFTVDVGHYINVSGQYMTSTPYRISSPITLKSNEKISITGLSQDVVSVIAQKNGDTTYTPLVIGESLTVVKTYEYTNNNLYDIDVVLSYNNTYPPLVVKTLNQNIFTDIYENINEEININNQKNNYLMAFDHITAIGDSLTFSQVYTSANDSRQSYNPYPKVLGRLLGCDYEILAVSGDTPISWWTRYENNLTNTDKDNLFIIYLGTNGGLTNTLATDAPEDADPSTWANTNTGCYAKIVNKCVSLGGKVILIQPWIVSTGSIDTTNSVISQIATRFNCLAISSIKLENPNYHYYPDKTGTNNVHLNDLGYAAFAQQVVDEVSKLSDSDVNKLILN